MRDEENSLAIANTEHLGLPRLCLRGLDRRPSRPIRGKIADMKLEVLSLVLRLDCLSCLLTVYFDDSGWEKMLGRLDTGGRE